MRFGLVMFAGWIAAAAAGAQAFSFEEHLDLMVNGKLWLRTMTTPFDPSTDTTRDATYKVYTHVFDFEGGAPITKGPGGKYTHHRGMFIGWKDTMVGGVDFDTWHMPDNYQQHIAWKELASSDSEARQVEAIEWRRDDGTAFIRETRTIVARNGGEGVRIFDFQSILESLEGTIQLKGDLQHAGMQIRLANEVSEHEESTQYILPEGAEELDDDKVVGAWWVGCSAEVGGKRYWLMHMTPPDNPAGQPVYSIRRYARFGSFFEPELVQGTPLELNFRIVVSDHALDGAACAELYRAYADQGG